MPLLLRLLAGPRTARARARPSGAPPRASPRGAVTVGLARAGVSLLSGPSWGLVSNAGPSCSALCGGGSGIRRSRPLGSSPRPITSIAHSVAGGSQTRRPASPFGGSQPRAPAAAAAGDVSAPLLASSRHLPLEVACFISLQLLGSIGYRYFAKSLMFLSKLAFCPIRRVMSQRVKKA